MKSVTLNNILIDHISPTPLCEIMGRNKSDKFTSKTILQDNCDLDEYNIYKYYLCLSLL